MVASNTSGGQVGTAQGQNTASGGNPFQLCTNLYAEKNVQGLVTSQILGASPIPTGGAVNAGQFLRAVRLVVRTVTPGTTGVVTADGTTALFSTLDLNNVDGSEILFAMGSNSHYYRQKFAHPWLTDMTKAYDYTTTINNPQGTFMLMPETRFTAGALANTDTRSQYRYDAVIGPATNIATGYTVFPTISITPYMDAWAQPDDEDLMGTPNQPIPPGINLQCKVRHQIFNMAAAGDNTFVSTLTGNAIRVFILLTRNAAGARVDGLSDPLYWQLDNRSMGKLSPDLVWQWANDFYNPYAGTLANGAHGVSDTGVYVFPRFLDPGDLTGQAWLYTSNTTKNLIESSTNNAAATLEWITDEIYPVGDVDPSLVDI